MPLNFHILIPFLRISHSKWFEFKFMLPAYWPSKVEMRIKAWRQGNQYFTRVLRRLNCENTSNTVNHQQICGLHFTFDSPEAEEILNWTSSQAIYEINSCRYSEDAPTLKLVFFWIWYHLSLWFCQWKEHNPEVGQPLVSGIRGCDAQ